jgi:hypothetical protein
VSLRSSTVAKIGCQASGICEYIWEGVRRSGGFVHQSDSIRHVTQFYLCESLDGLR